MIFFIEGSQDVDLYHGDKDSSPGGAFWRTGDMNMGIFNIPCAMWR